jgi:prevent-host-death family protein
MATHLAKTGPSVGIKELKDQASAIIERVQKTRRAIVITKNNRGVARIVPMPDGTAHATLREKLSEMGILASPARLSFQDLVLEKVQLDASAARAAIRSDREED